MQDDYAVAFDVVKEECERQLKVAELPEGIQSALDERGLIFGEHPEVMAILPLLTYQAAAHASGRKASVEELREIAPVGAAMEFLLAAADILDDVQDLYVPEDARLPDRMQAHYIVEMELFTALMLLGEQSVISLLGKNVSIDRATQAISLFNTLKRRAFSGQYEDAHCKVDFNSDLENSIEITRGKCGNLARCAAQMGAVLATDDKRTIDLAGQYAEHLAIARQLHDDISNLWPRTGKGDDLEQLKGTLPLTFSLNLSTNGVKSADSSLGNLVRLEHAVGPRVSNLPGDEDISKARDEIFENGGMHFGMLQSLIHLVKARKVGQRIEKLPPGEGILERLAST